MRKIIATAIVWFIAVSQVYAINIEERRVFGDAVRSVRVLSTIDVDIIAPVFEDFLKSGANLSIDYQTASSQDVYDVITQDRAKFDMVISSAMDLQMKLANDGFASSLSDQSLAQVPAWARWRDVLVALAQEPVVTVLNRDAFSGAPIPETRTELAAILRENPDRYRGMLGTYDPMKSGAGYLFASQDARYSDTFWRLAEIMGGLRAQLYTTSSSMIEDVATGKIAMAYNVVGSYAMARLAGNTNVQILEFKDFTHILLRSALIPASAENKQDAEILLAYLLSDAGQTAIEELAQLPRISEQGLMSRPHQKPIRMDPGLLVYVDPIKKQRFLAEWSAAVLQP
ncbi:MAG: ABC transporter substrate-binding protein [Rhodobacteraceae bacterium]|nr:ABC transporter substrate-binding protein [Paracoccaceae bacterium]